VSNDIKVCSYCGATEKETRISLFHKDKYYCRKHYLQLSRYGKIFERTIYDKNEIITYDDYAEVILYDKYGKEKARTIIDIKDVEKVATQKWYYLLDYCVAKINNNNIRMQNFLTDNMVFENGKYIQIMIDHIDRDKLNNRRDNFRVATKRQNATNSKIRTTNKSGVTGVLWYKGYGCWLAQITYKYKNIALKYTNDFDEAVIVRLKAEVQYFKEHSSNYNKEKGIIELTYTSQTNNKEKHIEMNLVGNILIQNKELLN